MRWKVGYCILLAYCVIATLAHERPKRDLLKLKRILASKLLKQKVKSSMHPNYKLYRIPGYDNILVKATPVKTTHVKEVPVTMSQDNNMYETFMAIDNINNLINLGILNSKDDKNIENIIVPILQPSSMKFMTTEITKTYAVKPQMFEDQEKIKVKKPLIEVTEDISIVPDDIKYSYKQTTEDEETTTFVSKNNPNSVINTTKMVPRLPNYIKMRLQEVASMGFNPYAFIKPGAVIPARSPILVEEIDPTIPQSFSTIKEPVNNIYSLPVVADGIKPPVLVQKTVKVPAVPSYISDLPIYTNTFDIYTQQMDFHKPRPILMKETVGVHPVLPLPNSPTHFPEHATYITDFSQQPDKEIPPRSPILVKETIKIPAVSPAASTGLPTPMLFNKPIQVADETKTSNNKLNSGYNSLHNNSHNYYNQVSNIVNNRNQHSIPPPPSLSDTNIGSKEISGYSYSLISKNGVNNFNNMSMGNAGNSGHKGTTVKEMTALSILGDSIKVKRFSDLETTNQTNNKFGFDVIEFNKKEAYNSNVKDENDGVKPFTADNNNANTVVTDIDVTTLVNKIEKEVAFNTEISELISNDDKYNKNMTSIEHALLTNYSEKSIFITNDGENSEIYRGDIPQIPFILSEDNEDTFKKSIINNDKNIITSDPTENHSEITSQITIKDTQSGNNDSKLVHDVDIKILSGSVSNDVETSKNRLNIGSIQYFQRDKKEDIEAIETKPKEISSPPSLIDNFDYTSSVKTLNSVNNVSAFESLVNNTSNESDSLQSIKSINNNTTEDSKNSFEKNDTSLELYNGANASSSQQKMNTNLNSKQARQKSYKNRSRNVPKSWKVKGDVAESSSFINNSFDIFITKSESVLEKVQNISNNQHPSGAVKKDQVNNNQLENKINASSDTEDNIRVKIINGDNPIRKGEVKQKGNNTLFGKRKRPIAITLSAEKFATNITKRRSHSVYSPNKTVIFSQNDKFTSNLNNHHRAEDIFGRRIRPVIVPTTRKGNNFTQVDKYALNPSRKEAISRLIGRNGTVFSSLKNFVTDSALTRLGQKQATKSSNNRVILNINRKIDRRGRRDVNIINRIPNHYLYIPPIDVDVPQPVRSTELDRIHKEPYRSETLNNFKYNNVRDNPIIVMHGNSNVFQSSDVN